MCRFFPRSPRTYSVSFFNMCSRLSQSQKCFDVSHQPPSDANSTSLRFHPRGCPRETGPACPRNLTSQGSSSALALPESSHASAQWKVEIQLVIPNSVEPDTYSSVAFRTTPSQHTLHSRDGSAIISKIYFSPSGKYMHKRRPCQCGQSVELRAQFR